MRVVYACQTDLMAPGGVSEVARRWLAHVGPRVDVRALVAPDLRAEQVIEAVQAARPDIVHLWAGQVPAATYYSRAKGIPVVLDRSSTAIGWQSEVLAQEAERLRLSGTIDMGHVTPPEAQVRLQEAEYEVSTIVTPSAHAATTFPPRVRDRVHVVPTGCNVAGLAPRAPPGDPFTVLFSGHNWFRKGLAYLWMAGLLLQRRGLAIRYEFNTGSSSPVPLRLPGLQGAQFTNRPQGLGPALERAHVMVLPTLEDAVPLSLDDAMAAAVPCITTPNAGSRVLEGQSGFIVPIRDPQALADKIEWFYRNRDEAARFGRRGRATAERATWDDYADNLMAVYEGAVGDRAG